MPETRSAASRTRLLFATIVVATIALHGRTLGFGFSYLDDDVLAVVELRAEIAVNPDDTIAHDNLARVLRALGRADEAATEEAIVARQRAAGP